MKIAIVTLILCSLVICCKEPKATHDSKEFVDKVQNLVLSEDKAGQEYFFKILLKEEVLEYKVVYLGKVKTGESNNLKFLFITTYSGLYEDSKRANSKIYLYQGSKRLGYYYIGGEYTILPKVASSDLIISYDDENCNKSTKISFKDNIPEEIFIKCKEENGKMFGDLYKFEKDE